MQRKYFAPRQHNLLKKHLFEDISQMKNWAEIHLTIWFPLLFPTLSKDEPDVIRSPFQTFFLKPTL